MQAVHGVLFNFRLSIVTVQASVTSFRSLRSTGSSYFRY